MSLNASDLWNFIHDGVSVTEEFNPAAGPGTAHDVPVSPREYWLETAYSGIYDDGGGLTQLQDGSAVETAYVFTIKDAPDTTVNHHRRDSGDPAGSGNGNLGFADLDGKAFITLSTTRLSLLINNNKNLHTLLQAHGTFFIRLQRLTDKSYGGVTCKGVTLEIQGSGVGDGAAYGYSVWPDETRYAFITLGSQNVTTHADHVAGTEGAEEGGEGEGGGDPYISTMLC